MSKTSFLCIICVSVVFLLLWTFAPIYAVFISSITPERDLLKDKLLFLVLFTQMLPIITVVIPLYLIFSTLHMLDRRITLVIVYSS